MSYRSLLVTTALTAVIGTSASAHFIGVGGNNSIDGSLCVGFDCAAEEAFGFDTIRLKENNLRVHFNDTSVSASFPNQDWRIIINDSLNGGAEHFTIEDATTGNDVIRAFANARNNALVVDSQGDLGLGTATPATDIDIKTGNTPTVRLQQDGSSGFSPQSWDMAGNETNFFIRDATNGSTLPFRIQPGASSSALFIASNDEIGLSTASPGADLHVLAGGTAFSANADTHLLVQNNAATGDAARISILGGADGSSQVAFGDSGNEFSGRVRYEHNNNSMDFFVNGGQVLELFDGTAGNVITTPTSGAVLTTAGVWQNASSRALKQNINALSLEDAVETLQGLEPVTYNYKVEPNELTVGFIAEDVPDMVATASHKTLSGLDIIAVLTRVVQDQSDVIADLEARLELLETQE